MASDGEEARPPFYSHLRDRHWSPSQLRASAFKYAPASLATSICILWIGIFILGLASLGIRVCNSFELEYEAKLSIAGASVYGIVNEQVLVVFSVSLTEENLLFLEAWRTVDRAYVDKSFNGQSWFRYREDALRKEPMKTREETCTVYSSSPTDLELDFEVVISWKQMLRQ